MQADKFRYAAIANGIYVRTRVRESLLERYRREQAECPHEKRDPRGMCYRCGHRHQFVPPVPSQ